MSDRGPVQFLLHFLRTRPAPEWKVGLALALVATLALLPGEESLYHKAKDGLTQSLRQAAWKHALAGEPESKPWPWDQATPAENSVVPRLGLSATVHCDAGVNTSEQNSTPARKSASNEAHDPHLASDDPDPAEDANPVSVTGPDAFTDEDDDDQLWEPGAPAPIAAPLSKCAPLDSANSDAFHLMIEAIEGNGTNPPEIEQKL